MRPSSFGASRIAAMVRRHPVGLPLTEVDTPSLIVDLDAMERNLSAMQAFADQHHVKLRPHAKMHKSAALAHKQILAGAVGVCVQKVSEAEALFAEGVADIFVSNEVVNPLKLMRLAALAKKVRDQTKKIGISVCCDSILGVERLAAALYAAAHSSAAAGGEFSPSIRVLVEIDVGQRRCGTEPGAPAAAIAFEISKHADVMEFGGIHAYHGAAQHIRSGTERAEVISHVCALASATKEAIEKLGISVPLITGAGTGTFAFEALSGVYTEIQPGSYLFMDRDYHGNGAFPMSCGAPLFEQALFVVTEVQSVSADGMTGICDAGHKSHAIDSGLPSVYNGRGIVYENMGDEHGKLVVAADGGGRLRIGQRLYLVPGHCDPTVNLHDTMIGVRGGLLDGRVECCIDVTARGCLS